MSDRTAISCVECVRAAGLKIPQQVSIVGSDDHPVYTSMYPLTTVRIDYQRIGSLAASMIDDLRRLTEPRPVSFERRFVGGELVVRKSSQLRLVEEPRIAKAIDFMQQRFHEEITVGQLARVSGMCRANFAMKFVETIGQSPIQYLINYRLQKSKALLMRTHLNICEVGARVGFGKQSYFGRTFRKYQGVTPKQFRQQRAAGGKVKPKAEARTTIIAAARSPTSRQLHASHAA
jgi:AraC-like DNA-binding protein